MSRWSLLCTHVLALGLLCCSARAPAATCTWNVPSGNWNVIGNWSGCADAPGPSTRTPGPADIALIAGGAASFNVDATVAEFEIGASGSLTLTGGGARFLTVNNALRLNGGTLSTTGTSSFPFFQVILAAGGNGQVLATSTLSNTVELENRGSLQLLSASGTALNILNLSRLINIAGASFTLGGGDARVHLDGAVPLTVRAGAVLNTNGNVYIGKSIVSTGSPRIESYGAMHHVGPGTLTVQGLGTGATNAATLQVEGELSISNGTVLCNGLVDNCRFQSGPSGSEALRMQLNNGVFDRGGPTAVGFSVNTGGELRGNGSVNGPVTLRGLLAPGGVNGPPYGTIAISGTLQVTQQGLLDLDLGGSGAGSFDRVQVGGAVTVGNTGADDGHGVLNLRLAAGYQPGPGDSVPVLTYASAGAGSAWYRVDDNSPLDFATRFDATVMPVFPAPRIFVENTAMVEGNSGSSSGTINIRLSHASTQTITAQLESRNGTATSGLPPSGDFLYPGGVNVSFAPGVTLQTKPITVHGDTVVEGDEAFTLTLTRNEVVNAAFGSQIPGSPKATGTILTDDLAPGTRFVLAGKDTSGAQIRRYTSTGVFVDAWGPNISNFVNYVATGMCFSPEGNVLTTRFAQPRPIYYNHAGAVIDGDFGDLPGTSTFTLHESCVFDLAGNAYIGQAGISSSTDAQVAVKKFDRYGNFLDSFTIPTGPRGTDWIELAGDQCTLYYTSEDTTVRRYNLCTRTPMPDFAIGLTPPFCYALRLRPNREVMVACQDAVHRLSPQGVNLQTYTRQSIGETNVSGLFALNLDPDGTSFWTAGLHSGNVYRVDIASGIVLASFNSGTGGVSGLAVYDEIGDDTIFVDGFELPPPLAPIVATGPSAHLIEATAQCEREFAPRKATMPHYVPHWVALVVVDANDCSR